MDATFRSLKPETNLMMKTSLFSLFGIALLGTTLSYGQQPPAPPPPSGDGGGNGALRGNIDLSAVPVPAADKVVAAAEMTPEEKKAGMVMITVVPVGYVPAPIIYLDSTGMPREKYRNPMEYPPAIYKVKTSKGDVKITGAQNQLGPGAEIPRRAENTLYYEEPLGEKDTPESKPDRLRSIGNFQIPPKATHLIVVVWKEPEAKLWTSPKFKVLDVSTGNLPPNGLIAINASSTSLVLGTGKTPYKVGPGYMGRVDMPVNARGEIPMFVSAMASSGATHELSQTVVGTSKDSRLFLLAWGGPQTPGNPSGILLSVAPKRLPMPTPPSGALPGPQPMATSAR